MASEERNKCPHCDTIIPQHWRFCDSRDCQRTRWREWARKKREKKMEKIIIINTICDCPEGRILTPNLKACDKCEMKNPHYHPSFVEIYKKTENGLDKEKLNEIVRKRNKVCIKCENPKVYRNSLCEKCYKDKSKLDSLLKRQRHFIRPTASKETAG